MKSKNHAESKHQGIVTMIFTGLRFGMLLQLAVGPLCLLVFNTSMRYGFLTGLQVILAIALIDALYITLSCLGISAVINRTGVKTVIKLVGCCVLVLFGINIITSAFNLAFLPGVTLLTNFAGCSLFIQGLLLTASNPLTIIFWDTPMRKPPVASVRARWGGARRFMPTLRRS